MNKAVQRVLAIQPCPLPPKFLQLHPFDTSWTSSSTEVGILSCSVSCGSLRSYLLSLSQDFFPPDVVLSFESDGCRENGSVAAAVGAAELQEGAFDAYFTPDWRFLEMCLALYTLDNESSMWLPF
jgi:hypothetical protein